MLKPLPTNTSYTVHEILIPSMGKKLRFRPFLVKENKALMIAQASNDQLVMLNTLKSIVASCCVEQQPLDVDQLATFDFEYLLIRLRSISVDNNVTLNVVCEDPHDGMPEQSRTSQVLLNLDNIEVIGLEKYKTKIRLSDDLFVLMKKPTMEMLEEQEEVTDYESNIHHVMKQIDKICTDDEVYDVSEYTEQQLLDWIDGLTDTQLQNMLEYFNTIPYCRIKVEWTCPVCGKRNVRYIEGVSSFF